MPKSKNEKTPAPTPPNPSPEAPDTTSTSASPATVRRLQEADLRFLGRVSRFLASIMDADLIGRARTSGYSAKEHQRGWALQRAASGEGRSVEHLFTARDRHLAQLGKAEQQRLLESIDEFENHWFPVTRAVIRRVVPREHRDAFAAAFFHDLAQQPLGPGVITSVSTFLQRTGGLPTSSLPGAAAVRTTLTERGLTPAREAEVRDLLERARGGSSDTAPVAPVSHEDMAREQQAQFDALDDLRDWFNDWGTTLRRSYTDAERRRLGLHVRHGKSAAADDDEADETDEDAPLTPTK